ncbi:MAG: type II secretion system minor pseudopilin GspJ [Pseudomonadota bacterium]
MTGAAARSDAGFTLVEILIAVFAFALLMGAGSTMVLSSLRGQEELDIRHQQIAAIDRLNAFLRSDLEQTVSRAVESDQAGEGAFSFVGGDTGRNGRVLGLVRSGWSNFDYEAPRSELLVVEYIFDEGQLIRRVIERPDRGRRTPESATVLLTDLTDVDLRFFSGGEPAEIWQGAIGSDGQIVLPDVVELVIGFPNDEVLTQRFLVGARR